MNREIKFRGKHSNKWIYGYLLKNIDDNKCYISVSLDQFYQVKEETVGQYTGLKDKNGVEIYEWDKVKAKFYGKEVVGEIGFSDGCFLLWNSCVSDNQLFIFTDIEVIGKIYENEVD